MKQIKVIRIEEEHEDGGPLVFKLDDKELWSNYIMDNIELGEIKKFQLKTITQDEWDKLEE